MVTYSISNLKKPLESWCSGFDRAVKHIINQGKVPVIVAQSRKMPLFLDYLRKDFLKDIRSAGVEFNASFDFLSECLIVTELALPFVVFEKTQNRNSYIILDDMLIYGGTLSRVYDDIFFLTGQRPRVSAIFVSSMANFPYGFDPDGIIGGFKIDKREINDIASLISSKLETHNLPIDIEFPIISMLFKKEFDNNYDQYSNKWQQYKFLSESLFSDSVNANKQYHYKFSHLVDSEISSNVDFTKFRFFCVNGSIKCEVFAPEIVSQETLFTTEHDLFSNKYYQEIWDITTKKIRTIFKAYHHEKPLAGSSLSMSVARSLCVWYNYLNSLSAFNAYINDIYDNKYILSCNVDSDILCYLIGREYGQRCGHILNILLANKCVNVRNELEIVNVKDSFGPSNFKQILEREKFVFSFDALMNNRGYKYILMNIFKFVHYENILFNSIEAKKQKMHFGETFQSLMDCVGAYQLVDEKDVHDWIDEAIDKGYVVPKYEVVSNDNGTRYWRRYFHSGIRKQESH